MPATPCSLPRRPFPKRFYLIPRFLLENSNFVLRDCRDRPNGLHFLWRGLQRRSLGFIGGDPRRHKHPDDAVVVSLARIKHHNNQDWFTQDKQ